MIDFMTLLTALCLVSVLVEKDTGCAISKHSKVNAKATCVLAWFWLLHWAWGLL